MISGLTLDASLDSLARLYHRTAVAIALGTRHILDALNAKGYAIDHLHLTGGHTRNPLLMELYADATGCTVAQAAEDDAVLLGTAMSAATAAGLFPDLPTAAAAMARPGPVTQPEPRHPRRTTTATTAFSSRCTTSAARWSGSADPPPAEPPTPRRAWHAPRKLQDADGIG